MHLTTKRPFVILYEHPFNERIRSWLRLDRHFLNLGALIKRESRIDHHYALCALFELMDIASRADLKTELISELEQHQRMYKALRGNPNISEEALDAVSFQLDACLTSLNQHASSRLLSNLEDDAWLMSLRKRMNIPGGVCEFDQPAYHAWLHRPDDERLAHLYGWVAQLAPLADAITNLLRLTRESGVMQKARATNGRFEIQLPSNKSYTLLRVKLASQQNALPEISANRFIISINWFSQDEDWKLRSISEDVDFEFSLCT